MGLLRLKCDVAKNSFGGPDTAFHEFSGIAAGGLQERSIGFEPHHEGAERLIVIDFKATLRRHQTLSLLEMLVVGPDNHGNIPHRGLQNVVNAHTEAATHIGNRTVMINRRKQSEAVDEQHIGRRNIGFGGLRIANHPPTFQQIEDFSDVFLTDYVWGHDDFPVFMRREILEENLFIGQP